ncbi:MAG: UDP-3-O-(3-hydroxymyristoyl)glucosamine N-acyltransferase [Saprospiraceae bacterium]|nr:UDP-3-O-(3-hydroxymyristoyl)glucosamine N-acyltransferase [Saprospiraceae bacterium]
MEITAAQLAQLINGTLEGDPKATVNRPARIEEAHQGDFAFMDNPKYEHFAYTTEASVLLVHSSFTPTRPLTPTLIRVDDVRGSLATLLQAFEERKYLNGSPAYSDKASIHPTARLGQNVSVGHYAVVEKNAQIGDNTVISPQVYIGYNVQIGSNCKIHPGARIHADCVIGDNCIIHSNAVIGADGFGYAPQPPEQSWKKMPHVGNVVLKNNVEIGACTCIDRAAMGSTIIHEGAKLDNLVHVAHNAEIGRHTAIAAQVGIAGSTRVGNHVQIGGQAGIVGHVHIADGTRIQAQSGLSSGVEEPNTALFGSPAIPYKDYIKSYAVFKKLPELERRMRELERKLREMGVNP